MSQPVTGVRRRKRVLLADAEAPTVTAVAAELTLRGFLVDVVRDGNQAISLALDRRPDLIVLDLALPHLDGLGALELLRTYPSTASTPVVVHTAVRDPESLERARSLECAKIVLKPSPVEELASVIEQILEGARSEGVSG